MPDDDAHSFSLAWKREIGKNLILFIDPMRCFNNDLIFSSILHDEAQFLGKFDECDLIWARCLQNSDALICNRRDIIA